jgi:fatty acid desaturase
VIPLIAGLQNHLQILMHEGAHYKLFRRRRWNDLATNVFCAVPFFEFVSRYRKFHFEHHRHLLDVTRDPEIEFYAAQGYHFAGWTPWQAARLLARDFCGVHYFQFFFSYRRYLAEEIRAGRIPGPTRDERLASLTVAAVAMALVACFGWPVAFYWLAPQPTWLFFFLKLQGYGEHRARGATVEASTHNHRLGYFARFFIYPLNSELHLEHHLRPHVPWFRLRAELASSGD